MFLAFAGLGSIIAVGKIADEMQSLEARIGQLPQTISTAGEAFDAVAQRASDAKQRIDAYASFYIKAGNATQDFMKTQEEVLTLTDSVAIALAASGSTAVAQGQAFFQLGQAIGSPTVQMEEMNTLIDVAPDLFRALGKAIPGANGNLKKFISTGTVTGEMLANGLVKVLPQFIDQMKKMPMTIGTATVLINNRWSVFINRLNRESGAVTAIANIFLKTFDVIEKGLADMVDFFGGATNTLKAFGIALTAAIAPLATRFLAGAILTVLSPIGLFIAALTLLGLVLEDVYQWLNWGDSYIDQFLGGLAGMGVAVTYVNNLKKSFNDFFGSQTFSKAIAALIRLKDYFLDVFPINEIMTNLAQIFRGVVSMFLGIMNVIAGIFKATLGFFTGDFELWYEGIKQIFSGLGDIFSGIWDALKGLSEQYLLALQGFFRIAFDAVRSIIVDSVYGGMVWAAKKGWEFIKSLFGFGLSTNINFDTSAPRSIQPAIPIVSSATIAGAASAPNGVPVAGANSSVIIKIDQTLPPGTTSETAQAARDAVNQAFNALPVDRLARQMGQVGG